MWKLGASIVGVALLLLAGTAFLGGGPVPSEEADVAAGQGALTTIEGEELQTVPEDDAVPMAKRRSEAEELALQTAPASESAPGPRVGVDAPLVVTGQVLNPEGEPVPGAMVYEGTLAQVGRAKRFPEKQTRPSAKADADGRFEIAFDEPGGVILCACMEGFADSDELPLDLRKTPPAEGVTLRLRIGATVTGTVFGIDQQPIAGRSISITCGILGAYESVVTAKDGTFELTGLNAGSWRAATYPSDQELIDAGEVADVKGAVAHLKQAEFTLLDGKTVDLSLGLVSVDAPHVYGVVRHAGRPVSGLMQWYPASRPTEKMVSRANAEGAFKVDLPSPGPWIVHVNDAGASSRGQRLRFDLAAGERREVEIDLTGGRILGCVADPDGGPIEGVQVELRCVGKAPQLPNPTLGGGTYTTDEEGRYAFELLLPGSYVVVAHGGAPATALDGGGPPTGAACTPVLELEGETDLEAPPLTLAPGETVQVSVVNQTGRPVSGASLYFHDTNGHCLNPSTITRTGGKGLATSPALSPRSTWVTATHFTGASQTARIDFGSDAPIELSIQGKHWIELDGGQEWIDETTSHVSVVDAAGRRWNRLYDFHRLFEARPDRADPKGPLVGPLPWGTYRIEVRTRGGAVRHGSLEIERDSAVVTPVLLR